MTPEQLFADLLSSRPAQPFVTYYDEATGERSELSAKSLANWVAKTHHLLTDELGLDVGDRAWLALPPHWISVPALLGCLTAGLCLVDEPMDPPDGAALTVDVAFVDPRNASIAQDAGIPDIYAVNPAAGAVGFGTATPPAGTADYVSAVRPQADVWAGVQLRAGADDAGIAGQSPEGPSGDLTRGALVEVARDRAAALGLTTGARAITTRDWHTAADWIDTVLAPIAVGGSVVFVRNASDDVVARRSSQERAAVRI